MVLDENEIGSAAVGKLVICSGGSVNANFRKQMHALIINSMDSAGLEEWCDE